MHLRRPHYVTWKWRIVFMRKQEHRTKTAFVKSMHARLVKSENYGCSNREGRLVIAAIYDGVAPLALAISCVSCPCGREGVLRHGIVDGLRCLIALVEVRSSHKESLDISWPEERALRTNGGFL